MWPFLFGPKTADTTFNQIAAYNLTKYDYRCITLHAALITLLCELEENWLHTWHRFLQSWLITYSISFHNFINFATQIHCSVKLKWMNQSTELICKMTLLSSVKLLKSWIEHTSLLMNFVIVLNWINNAKLTNATIVSGTAALSHIWQS